MNCRTIWTNLEPIIISSQARSKIVISHKFYVYLFLAA
jgi:hypothetical protein